MEGSTTLRLSHPRPLGAVVLAAAVTAATLAAGGSASAGQPRRLPVANAQPDLAAATAVGAADARQRIDITVHLKLRNQAGLQAAVRAVSDPHSKQYGHYLTAAQFRAAYSPAAGTVSAMKKFLGDSGLTVVEVPDNGSYVTAEGTVAQAAKAFGATLRTYRANGRSFRAAAGAISVPSALAPGVIAVDGLASLSTLMAPRHAIDGPAIKPSGAVHRAGTQAPPPDAFVNAPPCSSFYGQKQATDQPPAFGITQPYAPCGHTPDQLQGAYGLTGLIAKRFDGRGVTVAITDAYAAPTIVQDAAEYATRHGQAPLRADQYSQVLPPKPFQFGFDDAVHGDQCGEQGWYGEETLDVEAVHAVAPGANITYVASRSCTNGDFARTLNRVVDRHLADIVTNSWGGTDESNGSPQLDAAYQQVFLQAALQGIGMYFSSGDSGDGRSDNNGTPTVQSPANSPLVTAVGGTSLAVNAADQRSFETGWATSKSVLTNGAWTPKPPGAALYGAGGGTSRVFAEPWYQQGVVPAGLAQRYSRQGGRVVPDVSALGDPNTGMLIGETQTFPNGKVRYSEYRIGGTSLSSPVFAGVMAIADQAAGRPHGFANPALYAASGSVGYYDPKPVSGKAVVRVDYLNGVNAADGTVVSLRTLDSPVGTILRTRTGYDDITGLGTPNGEAFVSALQFFPQ
jgi:subtilase family serine protease